MTKIFYTLLVNLLLCNLFYGQNQKQFKFYDDFNLGEFKNGWRNQEITKNNGYRIDTISKKGRKNDAFLITTMRSSDSEKGPKRTEFGVRLYDSINQNKFLSFSLKIPKEYMLDSTNLGRETMICQWHSKPAPGKTWEDYIKLNKFNRPSVALYLSTNDNINFYLILRYGNNGKDNFEYNDYKWSVIAIKKILKDEWIDLVFEINWSLTNTGYISAWINNNDLTQFNGLHNRIFGANMHNLSPAYFKFGQYRYWDDTHIHNIYFDELRIGDSFSEVSKNYNSIPKSVNYQEKLKFISIHK